MAQRAVFAARSKQKSKYIAIRRTKLSLVPEELDDELASSNSTESALSSSPGTLELTVLSCYRSTANNHRPKPKMSSHPDDGEAPRSDPGALAGRAAVLAASGGSSGEEDAAGHRIYHGHGLPVNSAYRRRGHQKGSGGHRSKHRITNGRGGGGKSNGNDGGAGDEEESMGLQQNIRPCELF